MFVDKLCCTVLLGEAAVVRVQLPRELCIYMYILMFVCLLEWVNLHFSWTILNSCWALMDSSCYYFYFKSKFSFSHLFLCIAAQFLTLIQRTKIKRKKCYGLSVYFSYMNRNNE